MATKSTITITTPGTGITIIRTHPQINNTTIGITITRIHPQKHSIRIGIIALRTHSKKSLTRCPVIIKAGLKTEKTRNKIPGTQTVTK
jgi:hypothetical protein